MSMIGNFMQVTPAQLEAMRQDPSLVEEALYPDRPQESLGIDVDKAWHGIHFLLTGEAWEGAGPAAMAVLGGTEIGDDVGYGPARYLTPDEVREVAAALAPITAADLGTRFDADALAKADIYPNIWGEGDEAATYLTEYYDELRSYYLDAASKGNAMLKYLN